MTNDTLGDRMKEYEAVNRIYLPRRLPIIIRLDMRAGHTYTKKFNRPFDEIFHKTMVQTAIALCGEIDGCKLAYTQSDEISLLVTNNNSIETEPWFNNGLQKIVSISAAFASVTFQNEMRKLIVKYGITEDMDKYECGLERVVFDSRAFVLPEYEVVNYLHWRQCDASRNSIQMTARSAYSHKECDNKNCNELQEMLLQKGIDWNNYESWKKQGSIILREYCEEVVTYKDARNNEHTEHILRSRWVEELETQLFLNIKGYINELLKPKED